LQQALLDDVVAEETYCGMIAHASGDEACTLVYDTLVTRFLDDLVSGS
jgi:hypothetical protein